MAMIPPAIVSAGVWSPEEAVPITYHFYGDDPLVFNIWGPGDAIDDSLRSDDALKSFFEEHGGSYVEDYNGAQKKVNDAYDNVSLSEALQTLIVTGLIVIGVIAVLILILIIVVIILVVKRKKR
jgi:hypothetical protein